MLLLPPANLLTRGFAGSPSDLDVCISNKPLEMPWGPNVESSYAAHCLRPPVTHRKEGVLTSYQASSTTVVKGEKQQNATVGKGGRCCFSRHNVSIINSRLMQRPKNRIK